MLTPFKFMPQMKTQPQQNKHIGLVEDDRVIRTYLTALLQSQAGVESVEAWESAEDFAARPLGRQDLNLLLVDLDLPGEDGISLIHKIQQAQPELPCIVLTSSSDPQDVFAAMRSGASGYLVKESSPDELLSSIRMVIQDGVTLSPVIAKLLVDEFLTMGKGAQIGSADFPRGVKSLTKREVEVLNSLTEHVSAKGTAEALGLSHETIRVHMKKIYQKLHVRSKAQALSVWHQENSKKSVL
jgi:DNA-binding NarL/FixJ family response regulator